MARIEELDTTSGNGDHAAGAGVLEGQDGGPEAVEAIGPATAPEMTEQRLDAEREIAIQGLYDQMDHMGG
jgi:hypothetical protein